MVAFVACFAVAGHGDEDDVGAGLAKDVVAEAEVVEDVGAVVFDDDVAVGDELEESGAAKGMGEVEGEGFFVAVVVVEVVGGVPGFGNAGEGDKGADVVPSAGGFDFDDFGSHFGEDPGGVGAGPHHGEIGDADALEGEAFHVRSLQRGRIWEAGRGSARVPGRQGRPRKGRPGTWAVPAGVGMVSKKRRSWRVGLSRSSRGVTTAPMGTRWRAPSSRSSALVCSPNQA